MTIYAVYKTSDSMLAYTVNGEVAPTAPTGFSVATMSQVIYDGLDRSKTWQVAVSGGAVTGITDIADTPVAVSRPDPLTVLNKFALWG